ncbi:hypothetical protein CAEBREN_05729 [Caenorhabditis brenneri]|uniref:Uncharacterized protein n=1 Tax=Caenorhabditis brenneri TaxID=135651 RepID=G0P2L0_CAEBE|nr:hypothetical protein CAEBREN_05729 [Caenorhabditis brenneri]
MERHETEVQLIREFALYGNLTVQELFNKIPTHSVTMIIVEKLRRSLTEEFMLNHEYANDIRCRDEDLPPHKRSLRKFLEIQYLKPKMKIHLRGEQVRVTKICQSWMAKSRAKVSMKTFKDVLKRSEIEREAYTKGLETDRDNLNVEILDIYRGGVQPDEINSRTSRLKTQVQTLNKMIEEAKKDNEVYQKTFKTIF